MIPIFFKRVFLFGCLLSVGISCSDAAEDFSSRDWSLEMSLHPELQLTDSSSSTAVQIHQQFSKVDLGKVFFRDPSGFSVSESNSFMKLTTFGRRGEKVYNWSPEKVIAGTWSWGACRSGSLIASCEYVHLLKCIQTQADAALSHSSVSDRNTSNRSRSLLLEWSSGCGAQGVFREDSTSDVSFKINGGQIFFAPDPLLSLLVFKGVWSDYEEALVQSGAIASLPAVLPCNRSDGACLVSPAALSSCTGCDTLVAGQLYTVFFIEALRQDYSSVRSVIYVHSSL
jgi:hypothetical protein